MDKPPPASAAEEPHIVKRTLRRLSRLLGLVGLVGLVALALGAGLSTAFIYIGLGLMGAGLVVQPRELKRLWRAVRGSVLFWAAAGLSGYIVIRTAVMPAGVADEPWSWARNLIYVAGGPTLIVAWWQGGSERRIRLTLWVLGLGLAGGLAWGLNWEDLPRFLSGELRLGAAYSINRVSFYLAGLLLAVLTLGPAAAARLWYAGRRKFATAAGAVLLIAALVLLELVILTQSRQTWLALVVIVPLLMGLAAWRGRGLLRGDRRRTLTAIGLAAGVLLLAAGALTPMFSLISHRVQEEPQAWQAMSELRFDHVKGSIGKRYAIWQRGVGWVGERPIFGWGPGRFRTLVNERGGERIPFGNTHNLYLHILISLGGVGFALVALVVAALARTGWAIWRHGEMPGALGVFLAAEAALFAITNCFDLYYHSTHTMGCLVLLTAVAATHWLRRRAGELPVDGALQSSDGVRPAAATSSHR